MYTVNTFKQSNLVASTTFFKQTEAVSYLIEKSNELSLWVSKSYDYASSEGNKPEIEIELTFSKI